MAEKPTYEELEKRIQKLKQAESNRRHSEEQLIHSRDLMDYIISHARSAIAVFDRDLKYIYVSKRYLKEYKIKEDNVIGKHHYKIFPDIPQKWKDVHQKSLAGEMLNAEEDPFYREDGSVDWTRWECRPWYESNGSIGGIIIYNEVINERKKIEKTLRDSEEKYRTILESIEDGYYEVDTAGNFTFANDSMCKILGYSEDELMGLNNRQYMDEENAKKVFKTFNRVYKTGQPYKVFDWKLIKKDGSSCNIEVSVALKRNSKGQPIGFQGIARDITERKRTEEALRETNARHSAMVANIGDVIGIIGVDGILKYISSNVERWFGWKPEDLIGTDVWEMVHPEDIERLQKEFYSGIEKDNASVTVEYRYKCKDGTYTWIQTIAVNRINDTAIKGVLINYHDITDSKQADKSLRESEYRFKALHKASFGGIAIHDKGIILDCNKGLSEMTGYSVTELIGMDGLLLIAEKSRNSVMNNILSGYEKPYEETGLRKNGEEFPMRLEAQGIPYKGKNVRVVEFRDITEQKLAGAEQEKLKFQLQQSQKMESIGTLAGGIAHDFNNILFPIVGHTEMLLEDIPEDSPFQDSLTAIHTSALRAKDLVKQILTFSRQDANELILMKMQPVVKEALKLVRSIISTTIDITQDIRSDCGAIKADSTQIHQIVMNLATNAYHAMEETGGELKISLKEIELGEYDVITPDMTPGTYVCLITSDTGAGMDKKVIKKIFDPFFTTKEIGKGTGMGLSVVHGIVKNLGGAIQVYSEPGKGTEFKVYFPVEQSSFEKKSIQTKEPIQGGIERILLVDDEDAIVTIEKRMLERLGYQVTSRTSSIEALEAFRGSSDKFDLVITDMAMPNMPGDKLSAELTKIRPDIPVLLCTGFSETMSEEKAASIGIKGFLFKPIVMKDLSQKIREVLDENKV